MRIQWNKEWATPALVGVGSFVIGVGVGALAHRAKINREIDKDFAAMENLAAVGRVDKVDHTEDGTVITGRITDTEYVNILRGPDSERGFSIPKFDEVHVIDETESVSKEPLLMSDEIEVCQIEEVDEGLIDRFVDGVNRDIGHAEKEASGEHPFLINVFDNVPDWDQEAEDANRTTDAPYILHEDEFFADEKGYHQSAITYYVGDEILADENNVPIYNFESVTGPLLFGRGSHDPNCVYIRNDKTKAEWEITRHPGHYQIEIMGLHAEEEAEEDEIKHSQRIPRFRME